VGVVCALLATAPALANPTFQTYGRSFRPIQMPTIPPGSFSVLGDALPDGRILAVTGNSVFLESTSGSGLFDAVAEFDPALTGGTVDPSFVRLSPDGQHVAVGTGFAKPLAVFDIDALGTPGSPTTLADGANATYFHVDHFDAAWADSTRLAITAGTFRQPSVVTLLDTTSDPLAPSNPAIIEGIGGASAGIAFDSAGRLYTGNGFAGSGPSGTGWIKAFDPALWTAGPADFEQDGRFVADVLSSATLRFDGVGNLFVGGGDFGESDTGYLAVLESSRVMLAAEGGPAIDRSDPGQVRRLDPRGDGLGFFLSGFNGVTGELYVMDGQTWYATVPSPTGTPVLLLAASGYFAWRRRRVG